MNKSSRNLCIVFIVVFFLFFDTHFQMPILSPFARSLGATPFFVGLIVGMYSFFNILGNVISGYLIDSRSWKKPLSAGIFLITLSLFSYAYASSAFALLLIRGFHGFAGGLVVPATFAYLTKTPLQAGVGDEAGEASLSQRMSFYGAAIGLAALTGPPFAGILAALYGYARAYTTIALLMVIPALLIFFCLKGSEIPAAKRRKKLPVYYGKLAASAPLKLAFRLVFILMGATGTLASFLPLKGEGLGASPALMGGLFAVFAATAIGAQLFWPFTVSKLKLPACALAGFGLLNLALILIHYLNLLPALFAALALYGLGFGLLFPALLELVAQSSEASWKGLATGIFFVFFSLGAALVPPLGGLLQQSAAAVSPFLTAVIVSLVLVLTLPSQQRRYLLDSLKPCGAVLRRLQILPEGRNEG